MTGERTGFFDFLSRLRLSEQSKSDSRKSRNSYEVSFVLHLAKVDCRGLGLFEKSPPGSDLHSRAEKFTIFENEAN